MGFPGSADYPPIIVAATPAARMDAPIELSGPECAANFDPDHGPSGWPV